METQTLSGHVAVITGGSRGLGKAIALSLGSAGARIALAARDTAALDAVAEQVRGAGADVAAFRTDVTDEAQVNRLRDDVLARFGHADILVNNAGTNSRRKIEEFSLEEWNRVINTNLTSAFLMCRAFVPQMKGRGYGRIINMTSIVSQCPSPAELLTRRAKPACWD